MTLPHSLQPPRPRRTAGVHREVERLLRDTSPPVHRPARSVQMDVMGRIGDRARHVGHGLHFARSAGIALAAACLGIAAYVALRPAGPATAPPIPDGPAQITAGPETAPAAVEDPVIVRFARDLPPLSIPGAVSAFIDPFEERLREVTLDPRRAAESMLSRLVPKPDPTT